jgi:hypothetical protein
MPLWMMTAIASVLMSIGRFIPTWLYIAFISVSAGVAIAAFATGRRDAYSS